MPTLPFPSRRGALRRLGVAALLPACGAGVRAADAVAAAPKVLRYSMDSAETGFDPLQVSDIYSREITDNIFDAPLRFDLLARPVRLRPNTAAALPELSDDFRELTLRIRPGLYFADDPAFHGQRRELTAADYAYAFRRIYDPRVHASGYSDLQTNDIEGLQALRERAVADRSPFDYDAPVPGLQLVDRYTLRLRFGRPSPRFAYKLAQTQFSAAMAREVCEAYGEGIMEHPVGTGPFRLAQWRRSSLITLERNPGYRAETWDEQPAADDVDGQAIAQRLRGRRLPLVDRVEISIIEEAQPSWLAYLEGDFDFTYVRAEFLDVAAPGGRIVPALAKVGMRLRLVPRPDVVLTYFNMEDPVVGGYTPEKVALRRAVALGYDNVGEIRLLRKGLGIPPQGLVVPMAMGYDPKLHTAMSDYDPQRAKALLDLFGYVDRNGDGWRELPDGRPLVLHMATETDSTLRRVSEYWQKHMTAIGLRMEFERGQWPEHMKQARAGALPMWLLSSNAAVPDAEETLTMGYGPEKGEGNYARFDLPAYNTAFEALMQLPDGPERQARILDAEKLLLAYMPYKAHVHRVRAVVSQPWLVGYPANPFMYGWCRFVDIERKMQA
ncbi:MAG TPA: ABC transporter substrate-binding protein [Burkholderiaceae bacterium]|jgi:ABC-type transport system substrate-binding protein|nr:ABC transporter substrate-binding protein [Burkholderiaceae bacterium]